MWTAVCVCWGTKFSHDYVYNLKAMIDRNTSQPVNFTVFSDRTVRGVPTALLKPGYDGWWNKLQVFDPRMKAADRVVYFDLDTLITGNIDWLFEDTSTFMGIEDVGAVNAHQPHLKNVLQSAVMAWDHDAMSYLAIELSLNYDTIRNKFRGDGEYIHSVIPKFQRTLLQHKYPGKLKSYKYDVYPGPPDKETSIVCFHGRPSIVQAMNETITTPMRTYEPQSWIKDYWRR